MEQKNKGTKTIYLDIMVNDRFYCQIPMEYCPLFPIDYEQAKKFVESKRPILKSKDYVIEFSNERVLNR